MDREGDGVTGSWWVGVESREDFARRLQAEQTRIRSIRIDPTATDMARPRLNKKQRERIEEV